MNSHNTIFSPTKYHKSEQPMLSSLLTSTHLLDRDGDQRRASVRHACESISVTLIIGGSHVGTLISSCCRRHDGRAVLLEAAEADSRRQANQIVTLRVSSEWILQRTFLESVHVEPTPQCQSPVCSTELWNAWTIRPLWRLWAGQATGVDQSVE